MAKPTKSSKKPAPAKKETKADAKQKEATPPKVDIQVVNIVVSTSLEHDVPLEKMAATL
jgi:hypothetical protein